MEDKTSILHPSNRCKYSAHKQNLSSSNSPNYKDENWNNSLDLSNT